MVLVVGALDLGVEQFAILPLLPAIQEAEGESVTATTWLVTAYLLAAVAATPIFGRLGDMYGKRRVLLVALAAFALGSIVCAVSDSMAGLIAGRAVQGLGAGLGPLAIGIARDQAPPGRAPRRIALLVGAAGAGAAVGLLIGGVLADQGSVAAVFWVMFGIAAVLFLTVVIFVPESTVAAATRPDWAGALLLTGSLVTVLLAISEGNSWGWSSPAVVMLMAAAVVLLITFVAFERQSPAPMVDMRLLGQQPAWSANLAAFAIGVGLFIAGVLIPRIATLPPGPGYGFGLTYAQTGLVLLPGALGILLGGVLSGALITRVGARLLVACGALSAALGYALLAFERGSVPAVVLANIPVGFGIGLATSSITNLVVGSVDDAHTSTFAATTAVSRSVGAALGSQVAVAIVISAGLTSRGLPAEYGFTGGFLLGLLTAVVALAATLAIPTRDADPLMGVRAMDSPEAL